MNNNKIKFITTSIGLIIIVLLVVVIFPNSMSRFSNNKVLSGTIKVQNNSISNYLKNTNDLVNDNTKDNNLRYKSNSNNYIEIDNHLYQIIGIFNNNIKVIDTNSIDTIDDYYNKLSNNTKKIIIESIYYNGETSSNDFLIAYEEEKISTVKKKVYKINKSDYLFSNWISIDETKPVFYIDGNIEFIEGNGTKNNPYKI